MNGMATSNVKADTTWSMLADEEEKVRQSKMAQRYKELAALSEEERVSQTMRMLMAEYALPDAKLRAFTLSRLHTWLSLDKGIAQRVSASYEAVMLKMPGTAAMRRVALVQTLSRDFPLEQQVQMVELFPDAFGGLKEAIAARRRMEATSATAAATAAQAKKSWWAFWKR